MRFRVLLASELFVVISASAAFGQTAGMVSFQGLIRSTATGNPPITTPVSLEFRIFNADTGGAQVDMDGDGTVENTAAASGAGTDAILVGPLTPNGGIVSTKFGPVSPKAFTGCTPGVAGCRWLEVTVVGSVTPLSRLEMVTPPASAEQVNKAASGNSAIVTDDNGNVGVNTPNTAFGRVTIDAGPQQSNHPPLRLISDTAGRGLRLQTTDYSEVNSSNGTQIRLEFGSGTGSTYGFLQCEGDTGIVKRDLALEPNGGNVGIGTTSPVSKLHVKGGAISLTNTFPNNPTPRPPIAPAPIAGQIHALGIDGANSDDGFVRLSAGGGASTLEQSYIDLSGYSGVPDMHDNIVFGTRGTERMRIDDNGRVDIGGVVNPTARLHVRPATDSRNNGIILRGADSVNEVVRLYSRTNAGIRNGNLELSNGSNTTIWLSADPSVPSFLGLNNNVGIGTGSAVAKLHVQDSITNTELRIDNNSPGGRAWALLSSGSAAGTGPGYFRISDVNNGGDRLVISPTGQVGIGTTTPAMRLDVNGGIQSNQQFRLSNLGLFIWDTNRVLPGAANIECQDADGMEIGTGSAAPIVFYTVASAERMRIAANGNVGIGATTPSTALHVRRGGGVASLVDNSQSSSAIATVAGGLGNALEFSGDLHLMAASYASVGQGNGTSRLIVDASGNVGIGTTTPGAKLDVAGNMLVSGVPCCASDAQFKKNIVNVGSALGRMLSLRGVWFQWIDPAKHGDEARRQMGMIAQEVENVLPEWVIQDKCGYRYLNTNGFPALAVEAIRELKTENDALRAEIATLKSAQAGVSDRLARMEAALSGKSVP